MLLSFVTSFARGVAGLPHCKTALAFSHARTKFRERSKSAVESLEIEPVTSVWRPEPLARRTPAREVRRLEDVLMVPSFAAETQAATALILWLTHIRQLKMMFFFLLAALEL